MQNSIKGMGAAFGVAVALRHRAVLKAA